MPTLIGIKDCPVSIRVNYLDNSFVKSRKFDIKEETEIEVQMVQHQPNSLKVDYWILIDSSSRTKESVLQRTGKNLHRTLSILLDFLERAQTLRSANLTFAFGRRFSLRV